MTSDRVTDFYQAFHESYAAAAAAQPTSCSTASLFIEVGHLADDSYTQGVYSLAQRVPILMARLIRRIELGALAALSNASTSSTALETALTAEIAAISAATGTATAAAATTANASAIISSADNVKRDASVDLLLALQALIVGFEQPAAATNPSSSSSTSSNLLRAILGTTTTVAVAYPLEANCVIRKPFLGASKEPRKWNWDTGTWTEVSSTSESTEEDANAPQGGVSGGQDNAADQEDHHGKGGRILRDLAFDPGYLSENVLLSNSNRKIQQSKNRVWTTAIGTIPLSPYTGTYR
jgi:hypothetical protein